jgi:hypothetical protein
MINFRFHLVSLIAIFLALGLGILVGSSFVDQVIVDRLEKDISSARNESNARKAENGRLERTNSDLQKSLEATAPYTVQQRLQDVPIVVIAEKGIDGSAVKRTKAMLQAAGAEVPAVMWLDETWRLDDQQQVRALAAAVGTAGNAAATRAAAMKALAARVAEPPGAIATATTVSSGATPDADVLASLRDAGFIGVTDGNANDLGSFPSSASRALVLTGTDSQLAGTDTLVQLVRALNDASVPTTVAEVYDAQQEDGARGDAVAPVRGDDALARTISTIDDIELVQGQVSAVLTLEQLAEGTVGHYGYGRGASAPFPRLGS